MRGRRFFSIMAIVTLLVTLFAVSAGAATARSGPSPGVTNVKVSAIGPFHIQFAHSGKCVDVPAFSTANIALKQYTCRHQSNQLFYFDYLYTNPSGHAYYRVRNANSQKCLNVQSASQLNGASIIQYPCGAYPNSYFTLWRTEDVPAGWYWMQAQHSAKIVAVGGASQADGAPLIQWAWCYCSQEYVRLY